MWLVPVTVLEKDSPQLPHEQDFSPVPLSILVKFEDDFPQCSVSSHRCIFLLCLAQSFGTHVGSCKFKN